MSILHVIRFNSQSSELNTIHFDDTENVENLKGEIKINLLKGSSLIEKVSIVEKKEKIDFFKFK